MREWLTDWLTDWLTRSPIELGTGKNWALESAIGDLLNSILTLGLASPGIGISKFCFHRDLPSFDHTTTNRTTPISVKLYFKQKDFGEKWICFIKVKQLETSPSWHFSIFPFSPKFTNTHLISVLIWERLPGIVKFAKCFFPVKEPIKSVQVTGASTYPIPHPFEIFPGFVKGISK